MGNSIYLLDYRRWIGQREAAAWTNYMHDIYERTNLKPHYTVLQRVLWTHCLQQP